MALFDQLYGCAVSRPVSYTHLDVYKRQPYMAPVPMRGKRNDSRYLPYVIEKLAEWKGVTAEEMIRVTWENGRRLFRI